MKVFTLMLALLFGSSACAQSDLEVSLVKRLMAVHQPKSFKAKREYCGYLYRNAKGKLLAGPVAVGTHTTCSLTEPSTGKIVASWHTHGNADRGAWSEAPSVQDMLTDAAEGIVGYVGTPGGRLWYVDAAQMVTWQICGIGCLPGDPDFRRGPPGRVKPHYTLEELRRREAE